MGESDETVKTLTISNLANLDYWLEIEAEAVAVQRRSSIDRFEGIRRQSDPSRLRPTIVDPLRQLLMVLAPLATG